MLWEVEILPKGTDIERDRVCEEYDLLTHAGHGGTIQTKRGPVALPPGKEVIRWTARGYFLQGDLTREQVERLVQELLVDPLTETGEISGTDEEGGIPCGGPATVLFKPGVMDPAALSVLAAARNLGIPVDSVHTFRRYIWSTQPVNLEVMERKVLCNDAVERILDSGVCPQDLTFGGTYTFRRIIVPLLGLDDAALVRLSKDGQLSLNLDELKAIQEHFRTLGRDPTDVELETLAQTWSEHCSHKTLKGKIDFNGKRIDNLLKETIFGATQEIRRRLGPDDWCVSVFEDNAGVVRFDEHYHVCFKVETHNHPSAIEPYGGANTGLGGVIRDPLGTGLGAKPICNTDVFCFAPPDTAPESLPPGVLHPRKVMKGVVAGVRDYGNRIGIPTVNGAVLFDPRYLGNPLVYCGTVGLIPVDRCRKETQPGDLIVAVGGRTGRDGIHGATFSSVELTSESEKVSGGAVQIGNAITEKKLLDVLLQARDRGLYHAVTDCGAGGFSSAIGEMGEKLGAVVHLERAPLKYEGLSYTEIWISEAQERMVLAVPPEKWSELEALCKSEDVEATALGEFEATGRLRLYYQGEQVGDLAMDFLHDGRPPVVRQAVWPPPPPAPPPPRGEGSQTIPRGPSPTAAGSQTIPRGPSPTAAEGEQATYSPLSPLVGEGGRGGEGTWDHWGVPENLRQQMVEIARQFRKEPTPGEKLLWAALRGKQVEGIKFRRQQPIGPFVVDFLAPSQRLIVEVDGPIHDQQREADARRQSLLESLGLRFVRIQTELVEADLAEALDVIRAALIPLPPLEKTGGGEKASPTPDPSPTAGGGEKASSPPSPLVGEGGRGGEGADLTQTLLKILSSYNVCSKEWIVRQYDHEVQGGTVIKPLVGVHDDGPGDAAVVTPVLGSLAGLAIGCGINPRYGDLDPYWMAAAAVDEAVRNVVAVGADPGRVALLDNFCWANTDRPEVLGSLVRAAEACRDAALAYGMPFISGKDSLNNEFHFGDRHILIPPTLLISALGRVADVRRCATMDLKEPGNLLFLVGVTRDEMGGSHYHLVNGLEGGNVPRVDLERAPALFRGLHEALRRGLVRACHDLSEGGLAVAVAEMAFAGGIGADVTDPRGASPHASAEVLLFAESTTRFLVEVRPAEAEALRACFDEGAPLAQVGVTVKEPRLRFAGADGGWVVWAQLADLKEAWQRPLRW